MSNMLTEYQLYELRLWKKYNLCADLLAEITGRSCGLRIYIYCNGVVVSL